MDPIISPRGRKPIPRAACMPNAEGNASHCPLLYQGDHDDTWRQNCLAVLLTEALDRPPYHDEKSPTDVTYQSFPSLPPSSVSTSPPRSIVSEGRDHRFWDNLALLTLVVVISFFVLGLIGYNRWRYSRRIPPHFNMEATYDLNTEKDASRNFTVLVTGFAPWAGSRVNPSELLASRLPSSIHFKGGNITIAKLDSPIPVSYAAISGDVPPIIEKIKPDVVLHVGVDTSEFTAFHLERGASRDGYNSIPDATRRVFTKAEAKIKYGKSPDFLTTSLDVSSIFERWNNGLLQTNHSSPIRRVLGPEVIITEDAGDFVCGFLYYQSLEYFNSLKRSGELARPVLFLHVPQFGDDEDELVKGDFILLRLIEAIAHVYGQNS